MRLSPSQLGYAVLKRSKRPVYRAVRGLTGIRLDAVGHFRDFQQFMALGNHPYAEPMRRLEIERSAVWRLTGEGLSSVLHKPKVLA